MKPAADRVREELIARAPLFASLPKSDIEQFARTLHAREMPAASLLFREGEIGHSFYILLDGQVEIIKALGAEGERLLGIREAGSLLGEMSLFLHQGQRTASVKARTPVLLLEVTRGEFDALLSRHPTLAYEIARLLSQRLDEAENLTVRDLLQKNRELAKAYDELKAAQGEIIKKEKLESELTVARRIQQSILPRHPPLLAGFDFGMLMEPMTSVGGDFFDFVPLGANRLGVVIGDVSGHGTPAAFFMALSYSLIRAEASRADSPAATLQRVNHHLLGMNESGMFVTILFGILDGATREFRFVRAGHDLPLLLDEHRRPIELPLGAGQSLGILQSPELEEQNLTLPPGGLMLLYTDGVTEAADGGANQFGIEGLCATLKAAGTQGKSAQATCETIRDAVRTHTLTPTPQDDLTLLAVRVQ